MRTIENMRAEIFINDIKETGTLKLRESDCELYTVNDGPYYKWCMISQKTGIHIIVTLSDMMDERVQAHWSGFILNQNR